EWWNSPGSPRSDKEQRLVSFDTHRLYERGAGEDEREGGALLYFGLKTPLNLTTKSREVPSPMQFVQQAHQQNNDVWIDIEKPFWWDVPTWLASGQMNSIGLANNHLCRSQMLENEAWGRPRDTARLPNPLGNGLWTQELYYHVLNSGLRIPPSAGSASGVLPNPVGYNRVYVNLGDQQLSRDGWFTGLAQGRCFVTNGPLLRVMINEQLPGKCWQLPADSAIDLKIQVSLTSLDPITHIDVIHNGKIIRRIACTNELNQSHTASLQVNEPGWILVRAIADVDSTFRFASTAPWYLEDTRQQRRISKASSEFFLKWVDERIERIQRNVTDGDDLRSVLEPHLDAQLFWRNRVQSANADFDGKGRQSIEESSVTAANSSAGRD
ncbi:MAG: CehA/McbA family metallohydrolase, partial [Planctomycetaceae bacterium]|nr:CehA/McbA family metallohydrolase [Planctomycetaceae bacterium]